MSKTLSAPASQKSLAKKSLENKKAPEKAFSEPTGFCFVTVLPDGTEAAMNDQVVCREIALRVEMLSRGLVGRGAEAGREVRA